jgi:hypothetical protein
MTWEEQLFEYFDDLEQQAEGVFGIERDLEVAERAAAEYAQVTASSRLMASVGLEVALHVHGVGAVTGLLRRVSDGWCLVEGQGQQWLVRTPAIGLARGLSERSVPEAAWPVTAKLGLGSALRTVIEAGAGCRLRMLDGGSHDVRLLRVGADFVEAVGGTRDRAVFWFSSIAAVQQRA